MYNGIGLTTARGSGTNGYVQTNKFFLKARVGRVAAGSSKGFDADQGIAGVTRKPNKEILEHDRKRQIELKLVVLEDKLLDQGFTEAEVAERLAETRLTLEASAADETGALVGDKKVSDTQTHQIAARKERQMETLRAAFGIRSSESEEPNIDEEPTKKSRNDANKHRKSEHSFLDRGYGGKKSAEEENQKSENEDKTKSAKESERNKKEKSKKRMNRDDSSDTDIEKKRKVSKRHPKSRRNVSDDSESDSSSNADSDSDSNSSASSYDSSDSDRSSRRKNHRRTRGRIDEEKKHKASQRHRKGRNEDADSSSDDEPRKKVEKRKSSIRRHDSDNSSSDEEAMLKEKPHKRIDSPKKNAEKSNSANSRHDSDDSSSDEEGLSKEKQRKRIGGRYDSEDDSETDVEAKKKSVRLEENRKQNYIKPKSRTSKSVQRKPDSEDESDRGRNSRIRRKTEIDSESEGEKSRKPESWTIERCRRIGEDEKIEKHREKRHDSDDEEPAKKTALVKRGLVSSDRDDYPVKNNLTDLEYKRAEENYPVGRDDMNRRDRRKSPQEDSRPRSVVSNERNKEARDSDDDRDLRSGRYGQVDRRDVSHRNRSDRDQEQRGDDRWRMSYEDERRERKHGRDEDEARGYRSHGRDSDQNRERDYAKRPKYDDSRASERNRR